MWIFFLVLLVAAIVLECISLRQGTKYLSGDYRAVPDRIEPGETARLRFRLINGAPTPLSHGELKVSSPTGEPLVEGFRLGSHRQKDRYQEVSFDKRGVYLFTAGEIRRGDFFGLKDKYADLDLRRELLVFPPETEGDILSDILIRFTGEISARECLNRDPILTLGLREYTGQEPMKTISWTATARRGELMVREFEYTGQLSCSLILMTSGLYPREDELLDTLCSLSRGICRQLTEKGITLNFYTNARLKGLPGRCSGCRISPGDQANLLEILARVSDYTGCGWEELTEQALRAGGSDCSYILLVPREDQDSALALGALRKATGGAVLLISGSDYLPREDTP